MAYLTLKNINKIYPNGFHAVHDFNLDMEKGEYPFKVRAYECGPDGCATLPTVCNYLQEAASLNAESLGFSKSDFDSSGENVSWVLTRLLVRMSAYPRWGDEVKVTAHDNLTVTVERLV